MTSAIGWGLWSAHRSQSLLFLHPHLFPALVCALPPASVPEDRLLQPGPSTGLCSCQELAQACWLHGLQRGPAHRGPWQPPASTWAFTHQHGLQKCLVLISACTDFLVLVCWAVSAAIWLTPCKPKGVPSPVGSLLLFLLFLTSPCLSVFLMLWLCWMAVMQLAR